MIDVKVLREGMIRRPEDFWPVEDAYLEQYRSAIEVGKDVASRSRLVVVMIARNSCPFITNTLGLVSELFSGPWAGTAFYAYENDSIDETGEILWEFCSRTPNASVTKDANFSPDERGFQEGRTHRLAVARNKCSDWVQKFAADYEYVCVLDSDPHGGFSVDGVYNSLGWFAECQASPRGLPVGAVASYSLYVTKGDGGEYGVAQYDAYAARLNWWENRGNMRWFHALLPPVGSRPIPMNSAFGGLCLYSREAYRGMRYAGGDCEHVLAHKAMREHGYTLMLNPGSRYVAILP